MIYKTNPESEFLTHERCSIIEILNTNTVKDISIAQARVEPDITTELHSLDGDEFYYILEGIGLVEIDGSFKEKVSKGDVVHIKSGLSQRIKNISDADLILLCICLPKFDIESYTSLEQNSTKKLIK